MLKNWSGVQGILITGTPPIPLTAEGFKKGFNPLPCMDLLGKEQFTVEEANIFLTHAGFDSSKILSCSLQR